MRNATHSVRIGSKVDVRVLYLRSHLLGLLLLCFQDISHTCSREAASDGRASYAFPGPREDL